MQFLVVIVTAYCLLGAGWKGLSGEVGECRDEFDGCHQQAVGGIYVVELVILNTAVKTHITT